MVSVFDHKAYRPYLAAALEALPKKGYGARQKLAEFLGCQAPYISQVLNETSHLSFEQAEKVTRFLQLSDTEAEYFCLLVQEERAGTAELRAMVKKARNRVLESRKLLKNRVATPENSLPPEDQLKYFTSWIYSTIQVLLTIPGFREKPRIAERLGLPMEVVHEALEFLQRTGQVEVKHGEYRPLAARSFLSQESPLIAKLHQAWRLKSLTHLVSPRASDLHYSTVVSLSEEDFGKIREILVKSIAGARETIRKSKEEKLCSFCVDFYEL
jgi:uncharacterized protein (TIGR02147 family)